MKKNILLLGMGGVGTIFNYLADEFSVTAFDKDFLPENIPSLEKKSLDQLTVADLEPFDTVVNCLPLAYNKQVLELVAASKCSYLDLATEEMREPEQLAYQSQFKDRLFLANVGIAPGLDNLLVTHLVRKGATKIYIYAIEHLFSEATGLSWCEEDAVTSLNDNPISWDNGELKEHQNFSDPESISTILGQFTCYRFFGEELLSLGRSFDNISLSLKAGGSEIELARRLFLEGHIETGADTADEEPDGIFGLKILSDAGEIEVFLKSSPQLKEEELPGNHITFHTAYMAYTSLRVALKHHLTGFYFPENLPEPIQTEVLQEVKKQARYWDFEV